MVSKTRIIAECPSCEEKVLFVKIPRLGQTIECGFCEEVLEVIGLDPILLDWLIDEDDNDYDGDEFDDEDW